MPHEFEEFAYSAGNNPETATQYLAGPYDLEAAETVDPFDMMAGWAQAVDAMVPDRVYDISDFIMGPTEVFNPPPPMPVTIFPVTVVPETFVNVLAVNPQSISALGTQIGVVNIYYGGRWVFGMRLTGSAREDVPDAMLHHGQKARATSVRFRTLEGPGKGARVIIRREDGRPDMPAQRSGADDPNWWEKFKNQIGGWT